MLQEFEPKPRKIGLSMEIGRFSRSDLTVYVVPNSTSPLSTKRTYQSAKLGSNSCIVPTPDNLGRSYRTCDLQPSSAEVRGPTSCLDNTPKSQVRSLRPQSTLQRHCYYADVIV